MANGKIRFGKQSGGTLGLVFPDGVSNTEVVLPESGELATKAYADTKIDIATANNYDFGVNQTLQNVTASRRGGVTYTNSTGKPIFISIMVALGGSYAFYFYIDGNSVQSIVTPSGPFSFTISAIIPNNSTYMLQLGGSVINYWAELR